MRDKLSTCHHIIIKPHSTGDIIRWVEKGKWEERATRFACQRWCSLIFFVVMVFVSFLPRARCWLAGRKKERRRRENCVFISQLYILDPSSFSFNHDRPPLYFVTLWFLSFIILPTCSSSSRSRKKEIIIPTREEEEDRPLGSGFFPPLY